MAPALFTGAKESTWANSYKGSPKSCLSFLLEDSSLCETAKCCAFFNPYYVLGIKYNLGFFPPHFKKVNTKNQMSNKSFLIHLWWDFFQKQISKCFLCELHNFPNAEFGDTELFWKCGVTFVFFFSSDTFNKC